MLIILILSKDFRIEIMNNNYDQAQITYLCTRELFLSKIDSVSGSIA